MLPKIIKVTFGLGILFIFSSSALLILGKTPRAISVMELAYITLSLAVLFYTFNLKK